MLKLFNSLTRKVEQFKPIKRGQVGMYTCGPTVYDYMHIGNLRTFIMADILYRTLKLAGFEVKYVQNITDIDDKIIARAEERQITIKDLADEFTKYFLEDISKLNIIFSDVQPKATEHIGEMIKYIQKLLDKGLAYVEKDGSVYFDISKFPDYGKLSQIEKRELKSGTRTLSDNYTKDDVSDFALWKVVESEEVGWDSPWGKGRPGWHIECSVMSQKYLGETFDIHGGGIDLLFPHHENEIAQSEGKTGKTFVNFFVHGEHLLVDGQKMSKSLNNFFRLKDLEDKGFEALSYRYLVLTAHYRDKLNFTWQSLEAAQNALNNLREDIRDWDQPKIGCAGFEQDFMEAVNNDLNTPKALAVLWEMVKSGQYPTSAKSASILKMDQVLGLGLEEYIGKKVIIPKEVQDLVNQRELAREKKDFKRADQLRNQINKLGFNVEDSPNGPKVKNSKDLI
ncbi:cysteine--tRNA ligase [Candidatus Daviesbacteria bacterium]|nr:cysteine--tRNA ligase [Candidatus Daviesbacteria bacterium]